MTEKYDAIVIGAGIAGLGVSGLLAKAGKKVLLLEKNKNVGGRAATFRKKDGFVRSIGQHAALRGLKYDEILNRLGVEGPERAFFGDLVVLHEGKFQSVTELFAKVGELDPTQFVQMAAIASGEIPVNLEELDDIPGDQWIKQYLTSPYIYDLIRIAAIIMCTIPKLEEMSASIVYETIQILLKSMETWLAADGMSAFLDAMGERVKFYGGTVKTGSRVKSILTEKKKVTGVLYAENIVEEVEGEFAPFVKAEAPLVISAIPVWEIFKMLPEENFPPSFVKMAWNVEERTANLGLTAALRKPLYESKGLIMLDFPSVGYPGSIFMPTNISPKLAPEGYQILEASIICDYSIGKDQAKMHWMLEMLKKDLQHFFPGWDKEALWVSSYFHYEEPKRTPGRAGKHRPGVKAPGIEGLFLCGDSIASRALPGMECAADSAMLCAEAILGKLPD